MGPAPIPEEAGGHPLIRILFGRTRLLRRRALASAGIGRIDPFGRPTFTYLTGTRRKRDQVLREFEDRDAYSPEVHVFADWCAALWTRFGDGRVLLGDRGHALVVWRALTEHEGRWPRIAAIPDRIEASRAVARLAHTLASHRQDSDDPELANLIGAVRERIGRSGRMIRRTDALERLIGSFDDPSPALLRVLGAAGAAIVDDLVGSTPLEAAVVTALCRAWDRAGVEVVLASSSGRDRGGAEAGHLLGWDEAPDRELRVFAATATLRRAAFALVETGEAEVVVASDEGPRTIEPWSDPGPVADRALADAFADGLPVPVATEDEARRWLGNVRVLNPVDRTEEVRGVARALKEILADGTDPRDCLVAVADPAAYAGILADVLTDHGVPFRLGGGSSVGALPVARAVRWIVGQALDGFTPDGLCGLADFVRWPLSVDPRTVRRWCGAAGVRGGAPSTWALAGWAGRTRIADPGTVGQVLAELEPLAEILRPLANDADPRGWHHTLHAVFGALGLPGACEDALGLAAVVEAVDALARDLAIVEPGPWPATVLRDELERALDAAHVDLTPPSLARVPVVGVRELLGLTPAHTFVVGLVRGAFPAAAATSFLPGPRGSERVSEARYLLASLLRDARGEPWMRSVTLSWPATHDGVPVGPSPVLAELLDLPTADPAHTFGGWVVERPVLDDDTPRSRSDALRAAVRDPDRWRPVLGADDHGRLGGQLAAVGSRTGPLGVRDGQLEVPPPAPSVLTVTALETYLVCPARYWYGQVLRIGPPDRTSPELEPRRRGIALHRILEQFLRDRDLRPLSGEPDPNAAAARLHAVASEVLDLVEKEGGFDPLFQRYARRRWLAGLIDERPAGVLRAWLDAEIAGPPLIPEAVEQRFDGLRVGPVELRGVLDRVDRLPNGARLVTDYKTGTPPSRARVEAGLSLQPVAYATMVAAHHPGPVASSFLSLARPDVLRRTAIAGDPEALDAVCTPTERPRALLLDGEARQVLIDRAAEAAHALVAGRFAPTRYTPEIAGCRTCPFRRICRRDPERHTC